MSSLSVEETIITVPSGSALGVEADSIDVREVNCTDLNATGATSLGTVTIETLALDAAQTKYVTWDSTTKALSYNSVSVSSGSLTLNSVYTIDAQGNASTTGAVTGNLLTISTTSNTAYMFSLKVVATTSAGNVAVFKKTVRAKNLAGTVTLGTSFDEWSDADAAINTATVDFVVSGTNIIMQATGVAGQTIAWNGVAEYLIRAV